MSGRESHEDHFDLLPFIAILLCVLGTELLVTISMATIGVGVGAAEGWIPAQSKSRAAKTPVLIEWDGDAAIVHRRGTRERLPLVFKGEETPAVLEPLLDELKADRNSRYALVAVRPSGFRNYSRLLAEFRVLDITVGFEPIEQEKPVRLVREIR